MNLTRHPNNPVLKPNPDHSWENHAVFNGSPIKVGGIYHLLYRAMGDEVTIDDKRLRLSVIGIAESADGVSFTNRREFIKPQETFEKFGCEDPRVTYIDGNFYIFYTAVSDWPSSAASVRTAVAISSDLMTINERKLVTPFNSKAMALFPEKVNDKYQVILTVDSDVSEASSICLAAFDRLEDIANQDLWQTWYKNRDQHVIPLKRMYHDQVEVGAPPLKLNDDWLLIYSYIKNRWIGKPEFRIEAVILDHSDLRRYSARLEKPLLEPMADYESAGQVGGVIFPTGALIENEQLRIYYGAADSTIDLVSTKLSDLKRAFRHHAYSLPRFTRVGGPLIKPQSERSWEAKATFNPAAFDDGQKIHIIYRAMSFDNTSVLGHADSLDGVTISSRDPEPIYLPRIEAEQKKKPFANSGIEDPRITKIEDTIYMCYTAYDGVNPPRAAFTSISLTDFQSHRWNWKEPILISKPGIDDKDCCILPEKLDDRYVIFHRIGRNIVFDYTDSLDFTGETFLEGSHQIMVREKLWDSDRIGIAAPPIITTDGWLLFYHGKSAADHEYRVGAMLLYPKHPSIVIARTTYPLLEPELAYERYGHVNNVVFPCGIVLRDDTVYIYYGGGDQVCAVATISLSRLLGYLSEIRNPAALG